MRNIASQLGARSAPLIMALNILDYLYEEENRDYIDSSYFELRKTIIDSVSDRSTDEYIEATRNLEKLRIRFYARLMSYLTTIRQLEEYIETVFKEWTKYDIKPSDIQTFLSQAITEKKTEVRKYYAWRDKVFANLEIKLEAAVQQSEYPPDISKEEGLSLNSNPELGIFSELDIVTQHKTLLEHYESWEKLFIDWNEDAEE